ncbi:CocE/NonD family hydrolase [Salinadaptatus halalkaliphilus]|uniref:CocE/NonD family hydrolase n=1 Tax=Salinadaptatus halalkaliphilus TaxID=2419781 RepID=A0A4S3TMH8_9EURY|nr:CocE/NonD family hydrolase [Salinadaptatus halalkaliphilus]THE64245.1 CocE/NonD family hydrolase [Salinadaptatus halalkaliphilus]
MVSSPEHGVAAYLDRPVEMRDGTELATDIYRPIDEDSGEPITDPVPALLVRTPYDKRSRDRVENRGRWFAQRGYVVAIQDVRGRYASDGEFYLLKNEARDGADTVEWLSEQPYCDGQVGTMGTSYMAWVQTALATQNPDGLAAMFVNQGAADAWESSLRHNGAFELRWLTWTLTLGAEGAKRCLDDPNLQRLLATVDTREYLGDDPLLPGQSPLRTLPNYETYLFDYLTRDGDDEHWEDPSLNFSAYYDEMADVPTVYAGAWYDSYAKATVDNFKALADSKDSEHFLIMGPWTHGGQNTWTRTYSGEIDFGESAAVDHLETQLRFFDHYLQDDDTWSDHPRVQYFRMGTRDGVTTADGRLAHGGEWAAADEWPLPETMSETYFIHEDGTLSTDRPSVRNSSTSYDFDPRDPVPTIGGNCSSYYTFEPRDESIDELTLADRPKLSITGRGGYDQRTRPDTFGAEPPYGPLERRSDIVTYRTPPLSEPVEIAGPLRVRVFASTDAPDTDFTAKLIDEYPPSEDVPHGFGLNIADSICRARYRGYRREPDFVTPGEIYEFYMEPYPTANTFKAGHRIRLDISSSNYPRYDVNHNTGGPLYGDRAYRTATNTVYHEADHSTHIELPVVERNG